MNITYITRKGRWENAVLRLRASFVGNEGKEGKMMSKKRANKSLDQAVIPL